MSSDLDRSVAYDAIQVQLRERKESDCLRGLCERAGVDFTSNDYLGLA
jgi:7-keto-8-aminopelargonate synthetase-like enzyme